MLHDALATAHTHFEQILLIRMPMALKRLQPRQPLLAQPVLGQHAAHCFPKHLAATPFCNHTVHADFLERAWPRSVCAVEFLEALFARCVDVCAINGDHVVAAVGGGVEDGLVFAHEGERNRGSDTAQGPRVGANIDEMPGPSISKACLSQDQ
jgi:hypothetical protein